jgi:hypothetical protein
LATYAENLNSQQWATTVPQEERSVGVLVHHVANMYPLAVEVSQIVASGQAVAGVTWGVVAEINAKHAHENAEPDCTATVALLCRNSAAAAAAIRGLSDAQLDSAVPISLYADSPLTLQFWLEDHQISHSYKHLAAIKAAVG